MTIPSASVASTPSAWVGGHGAATCVQLFPASAEYHAPAESPWPPASSDFRPASTHTLLSWTTASIHLIGGHGARSVCRFHVLPSQAQASFLRTRTPPLVGLPALPPSSSNRPAVST